MEREEIAFRCSNNVRLIIVQKFSSEEEKRGRRRVLFI